MSLQFKIGDNAVYAGSGVGRITAIEAKELCGIKQTFYRFQLFNSNVEALVPVHNPEAKLRPIITRDDAQRVVSIVQKKDVKVDKQTWNRRYREYMEKIKTGSLYEIAEVFRDLYLLRGEKELSHGEKKMLELARGYLFRELQLCIGEETLKTEDDMVSFLGSK
ncbi:MAG: CarD family transcriptional regulator [Bdellovibrionales bacterium RBG_16_40_8]|nr:MAG: CarD family transcriptional regulator [Bdellovibrionales bacterium RBG_16_40_8]